MPPDLTATRTALLNAAFHLGVNATLSAVAMQVGVSKQAASVHVGILRNLGYLEPSAERYAPLIPTNRAKVALGHGLPIYGSIAAGPPGLADQAPDDYTPSLEILLDMRESDFLLRVRGESMLGIGVLDGDYVIVRPAQEVHDGEVAVVLIPGEGTATLKRIYHFDDQIILKSENPDIPRMSYPAEQVQVQGRMVGRVGMGVPRVSARWG